MKLFKRFLVGGTILGMLILGGMFVVRSSMGDFLRTIFETAGPKHTKGQVTIGEISLTVLGTGEIKKLYVGNPMNDEFDSPFALKLEHCIFNMASGSPTSDAVLVDEIILDGAELCFDGVTGANHRKIIENIEQFEDDEDTFRDRRIMIKVFKMTNTTIQLYVLGEKATMSVPDLQVTNVGVGIGGVSPREAAVSIYRSAFESTTQAVKKQAEETGLVSPIKENAHKLKEKVRGMFK